MRICKFFKFKKEKLDRKGEPRVELINEFITTKEERVILYKRYTYWKTILDHKQLEKLCYTLTDP